VTVFYRRVVQRFYNKLYEDKIKRGRNHSDRDHALAMEKCMTTMHRLEDARIDDHCAVLGQIGPQCDKRLDDVRQGVTVGLIARIQTAVLGKAPFVHHQRQGDQLAVRTLFFAVASHGRAVGRCLPLETGIGQVEQANPLGEINFAKLGLSLYLTALTILELYVYRYSFAYCLRKSISETRFR